MKQYVYLPGDLVQLLRRGSVCLYAPVGSKGVRWDLHPPLDLRKPPEEYRCVVTNVAPERGLALVAMCDDKRTGRGEAVFECKLSDLVLDLEEPVSLGHAAYWYAMQRGLEPANPHIGISRISRSWLELSIPGMRAKPEHEDGWCSGHLLVSPTAAARVKNLTEEYTVIPNLENLTTAEALRDACLEVDKELA